MSHRQENSPGRMGRVYHCLCRDRSSRSGIAVRVCQLRVAAVSAWGGRCRVRTEKSCSDRQVVFGQTIPIFFSGRWFLCVLRTDKVSRFGLQDR